MELTYRAGNLKETMKNLEITELELAAILGIRVQTVEKWLRTDRMPKYMGLVCDGLKYRAKG